MKAEDLLIDRQLLGHWEIQYPGRDGMLDNSHLEALELRIDGTFSWNPAPIWVKPEGRWGVTVTPETEQIKLHIEERAGESFRGQWLISTSLRVEEREERWMHWQRSHGHSVIFADRIFAGRWLGMTPGKDSAASEATYPYLVLRLAPAFYIRGRIQIRTGPSEIEVVGISPTLESKELNPTCFVRHPEPYATDGTVSPNCRALVIQCIQAICRQTPSLQMCIVWTASFCTYVDANSKNENSPQPSGGSPTGNMEPSDPEFDARSLSNACPPSAASSSSDSPIKASRPTNTSLRRQVLSSKQIAELLEHLRTLSKSEQQFDHEVRHNRILSDMETLPTWRAQFSKLSPEDQERIQRVERVHVQEIEIHQLISRELCLKDPPAGQYVSHWQNSKVQDPPQPPGTRSAPTTLPQQESAATDQESPPRSLRRDAQDGAGQKPVRWTLWDRCRAWYYRQFQWTAEQRAEYANRVALESHPALRSIENRIRAIQREAPAPDGSFEAWDRSERISILASEYEVTLRELTSHDK